MFRRALVSLGVLGLLASAAFGHVRFFYNDRAGFDAERARIGCTVHVGTEMFDCCLVTPPGGLDCYPFPPGLMQGVPNPPGAPTGLCQPLDIYSSYLDPSCDLVSLGAGFVGNSTIVVGANFFAASTNLDFRQYGNYCAVAFQVMDGMNGGMGTIDVYDCNDVFLASTRVNFGWPDGNWIGIVCDPGQGMIGRIEFYGDSNGGELCDDIELYTRGPSVSIYDNRRDFDVARNAQGCSALCCIDDFDTELTTLPGALDCYPFPPGLMQGVPNPPGAPVGLLCPMDMYSSYFDPSCDLVSLGAGYVGNATTVVGANYFAASTFADFCGYDPDGDGIPGYCAVAFEVMDPFNGAVGTINVYDCAGVLLGSFNVPFGFTETFYGVVVPAGQAIGVIEVIAANAAGELTDNWELYLPVGCPNPGAAGKYCTADIYPNNGDGIWSYCIDGDCIVNLSDLSQLLANYPTVAGATHEMGDVYPENGNGIWEDGVDGDGRVDLADLAELLSQYLDNCN